MTDDDLIEFAEELDAGINGTNGCARRPWRVAVIDDEPDVHETTALAIGDAHILGRPLEFLHAYSAREGLELLARESDIAVILLDVVMEAPDAGLRMIEHIRHGLGLDATRIILRTGQPGYAPEIDAIRDFDINDYKTKSDLTRTKLYAALTAAIRSYQQISAINASLRGLELILRASSRLMAIQGVHSFAEGAVTQLAALLQVSAEGLVCARSGAEPQLVARVVAGAGKFAAQIDRPLQDVPDARVRTTLERCLNERRSIVAADQTVLFFGSAMGQDMAVFLDLAQPLDELGERLVGVFCNNIAACYDNVRLFTQLNASSYLDALSNLPNRVAMAGLIDQARAESAPIPRALALVDIARFSELNQAFGHLYGDKVLLAFAQRLSDHFGGHAVVARIGGDTFGLFGDEARISPTRIEEAMATPLLIDGRETHVQVTIGILRLSDATGTGSEALKDANIALHAAKEDSHAQARYFSHDMVVDIHERVRLLDALRAAFDESRLHVVYQPQVALASGALIGVEALMRWRTDDGQYVEPDDFIPLAEQSGLIVGLGEWAMRVAFREATRMQRNGLRLRMAVNLSTAQLASPRFFSMLDAAIEDSGVEPGLVELEITESLAMHAQQDAAALVAQIRRRGLSVAIDDFGTGFTSLAHLEDLRVNRVKVDRAFISRLTAENHERSIASSITQLAHHMDLMVVAEGVETEAQREWLQHLGVDEGQGWLFGRPMPAEELHAWIVRRDAS